MGDDRLLLSAASCGINPETPLSLAGYEERTGVAQVGGELEANALVLRNGCDCLVMLSVDLLYAGLLKEDLLERLRRRYSLDRNNFVVAASHTHFAPSIDPAKPLLGVCDEEYRTFVCDQCVELLVRCLDDPGNEVTMSWASGTSSQGIGRRRVREGRASFAPAFDAEVDKDMTVISFSDTKGSIVALLWNWACHPTAYPVENRMSADYPGHVRAAFRHHQASDVPVVFFQGAAGDVRPREYDPGLEGTDEAVFAPFGVDGWEWWIRGLEHDFFSTLTNSTPVDGDFFLSGVSRSLPLKTLFEGTRGEMEVQLIRLPGAMFFLCLSAEPTSCLSAAIRASLPGENVGVAGYCGNVAGYLPAACEVGQGGYEVDDSRKYFNLSSRLSATGERALLDTVDTLFREVGAP